MDDLKTSIKKIVDNRAYMKACPYDEDYLVDIIVNMDMINSEQNKIITYLKEDVSMYLRLIETFKEDNIKTIEKINVLIGTLDDE